LSMSLVMSLVTVLSTSLVTVLSMP
jgi:hypothetical protein